MSQQIAYLAAQTGCKRAAVIGAGNMGAGIAAQFANAGIAVDLLDIAADGNEVNAISRAGIERQLQAGGFATLTSAALLRAGNIRDHLDRVADADWIIEAVVENLEIKRDLYKRLEAICKPDAVICSNTSTIPRAQLLEGFSPEFADRFGIAHFFNPPRHMELLELVADEGSVAEAMIRNAGRDVLGKTVITCRDTPGFIANRVGCAWMAVAAIEAIRLGLTVEEADAVQTAFGVPRTGIFGLLDLIGVDMIPSIWGSLMNALPEADTINRFDLPAEATIQGMIKAGRFGRKTKGGFYTRTREGEKLALDLVAGDYRPRSKFARKDLPGEGDLTALLADEGVHGKYARAVLFETAQYCLDHWAEISGGPEDVDAAMVLGYGWRKGPFAIMAGLAKAGALPEGLTLPEAAAKPAGGKAAKGAVLLETPSGVLTDLGDGLAALDFRTKKRTMDSGAFDLLEEVLSLTGGKVKGLVIGDPRVEAFSAGANVGQFVEAIKAEEWDKLSAFIKRGQSLFGALRYGQVPVVAAVQGFALGGGAELMLHCHGAVAHMETRIGLPESGLGILPAWGGCTRLLHRVDLRERPPFERTRIVFDTVLRPELFASAPEAFAAGVAPRRAEYVMAKSRVFDGAVMLLQEMLADGFEAPEPRDLAVTGPHARSLLLAEKAIAQVKGEVSAAQFDVMRVIAGVLTGGPDAMGGNKVDEATLLELEHNAFLRRTKNPDTLVRMEYLLRTGRPMKD